MYDGLKIPSSKQAKKAQEMAKAKKLKEKENLAPGEETGFVSNVAYITTDGKVSYRKRHPDAGLTAFIRYHDPIPTGHPSGAHPLRWDRTGNAASRGPTVHNGMILIQQLREIFEVVPSK